MTFEEDLTKRRIDVAAFAAGDPEKFAAWQLLYQQTHPNNFYAAVKMMINEVRRRFWLPEAPKPAPTAAAVAAKPAVRRATVPSTASAVPDEPSPSVDRTPEPTPARPRAVIRRPSGSPTEAAAALITTDLTPPADPAVPVTTTPSPETPKPGRARPVFRQPTGTTATTVTSTPPENTPATAAAPVTNVPILAEETITPDTSAAKPLEITAEAPKLPRPRPVFKRPTATPAAPTEALETIPATTVTEKPASQETAQVISAKPELPADAVTSGTEAPDAPTERPVAKPPRLRPVFKRPAKPDQPPE